MKGLTKSSPSLPPVRQTLLGLSEKYKAYFSNVKQCYSHVNNINKKNYDHLIDAGKALDKIFTLFYSKNSQQTRNGRKFLKAIKEYL